MSQERHSSSRRQSVLSSKSDCLHSFSCCYREHAITPFFITGSRKNVLIARDNVELPFTDVLARNHLSSVYKRKETPSQVNTEQRCECTSKADVLSQGGTGEQ